MSRATICLLLSFVRIASSIIIARMLIDSLTPNALPEPAALIALNAEGQGELSVTVTSNTVGSVPRGGQRIELLRLNPSASCTSDISLQSITVKHSGKGNVRDIAKIYALEGHRRISTATTFDASTRYATLRFRKLLIPKCSAVELKIAIDLAQAADISGEHGLILSQPSDIQSSAKEVSLRSEKEGDSLRVTPGNSGEISARLLPLNSQRLRFGNRETVARLQLTSDSLHDYYLKGITLKNEGSARDYDLVRLVLETRTGETLTRLTHHMDGSRVTLEFDPWYELPRSTTVVLLLKAEVRSGVRRTVQFSIEEPSDLLVIPKR